MTTVFDSTSTLFNQTDFKVDFEAAKNALTNVDIGEDGQRLVNSIAGHLSKQAMNYIETGVEGLTKSIATYLGYTGQFLPAAATVLVGEFAEWGLENFLQLKSGKTFSKVHVGDYVAIKKGFRTFEQLKEFIQQEALYKKETKREVDIGVVLSHVDGSNLEVLNLTHGNVENVAVQDIVPYTEDQMRKINANPQFNKIRRLILEKDSIGNVASVPTNGKVIHEGKEYDLVEAREDRAVISGETLKAVNYDELQYQWQELSSNPTPGLTNTFIQTGNDLFVGEYVYFLEKYWILGCVRLFRGDEVFICRATDGGFTYSNKKFIKRVNQERFRGTVFSRFKANVMKGDEFALKDYPLIKSFPELCYYQNYVEDGFETPKNRTKNPIRSKGFKETAYGEKTNKEFLDEVHERRQLDRPFTEKIERDNTKMIYMAIGAAALLAFSLSS